VFQTKRLSNTSKIREDEVTAGMTQMEAEIRRAETLQVEAEIQKAERPN
jgi:hypothetical protein